MELSRRVRAILCFVQTADAGSFAGAARSLGISAAAVGKNVASLEQTLGIRLFNRTTRTLQLTEEGRSFLHHSRAGLEVLNVAVDTVTTQRLGPSGRVRISTIAAFGREHLLPILPRLFAKYPSIVFDIDFDDRVVDLVGDGYDIAIRGGTISDSALISRPIFRLNTVLVASPEYLAVNGVPSSLEQLRSHKLIARRFLASSVATWNFRSISGDIITFDPDSVAVLILSAPDAVIQAACSHVGIANIGVHLAWPHLVSGALKVVMHDSHDPGTYEMVLQYPHRALIAPRVKAVVEFLLEEFARDSTLHVPLESLRAYSI